MLEGRESLFLKSCVRTKASWERERLREVRGERLSERGSHRLEAKQRSSCSLEK